jgi:hypothetical protein
MSEKPCLPKAEDCAIFADDQMILNFDTKWMAAAFQCSGGHQVLFARFRHPARVIMREQKSMMASIQGMLHNLPDIEFE